MKKKLLKESLLVLIKVVVVSLTLSFLFAFLTGIYKFAYIQGFRRGQLSGLDFHTRVLSNMAKRKVPEIAAIPTKQPEPTPQPPKKDVPPTTSWGGPELWETVNKRRVEFGVNPLSTRSNLCTIASIRLNELLELGKLDGHEGFSNLTDRRQDLESIFNSYSTVAEFLAMGGRTPEETVAMWEGTLGHKKLLDGGEYVWGCIYAQNTISVAIAAF